MIQALASYVMRGRQQAIIAAVLATLLVNMLGAAIVALVILRRGFNQAVPVFIAALVPATYAAIGLGEIITLPLIVVVALAAHLLRASQSWRIVLMMLPVLCSLLALALFQFGEPRLELIGQLYIEFMATYQAQLPEGQALPFPETVSTEQIASAFAFLLCFSVTGAMLLARYMQACLYKPGGFREEFHNLRFAPTEAFGQALLAALLLYSGGQWQLLGLVFAQPLFIAGVAVVHGYRGIRNLPTHLLVLFYLLVILMGMFRMAVVLLALVDSLLDFRKLAAKRMPPPAEDDSQQGNQDLDNDLEQDKRLDNEGQDKGDQDKSSQDKDSQDKE